MKKLILIALVLPMLTLSFTPADTPTEDVKWQNWNDGYSKAVKNKKIALIDCYTDWCGWCKKMDKDTYAKEDIARKINKYFVPIKFNPELAIQYELNGKMYSGRELLAMLSNNQSSGYPTTYFILTKKNRIIIEPGYKDSENFSRILDNVIAQSEEE
jgi:uncharacterized protein YyaL (SSP411 family)